MIAKYPHYLPIWRRDIISPALEPFEHYDHGKDADPAFPDLLGTEARIDDMTPATGSVVSGVQLSSLSDKGKDQLALLVAQRKVLSFTDQDFSELPIPTVLDFCGYFGRFQVHPVGGSPDGYPEIHIAHNGGGDTRVQEAAMGRITSMSWHTDGTASEQPPGIVFLYMLECPKTGGDTIFSNQVKLYNKLSPAVRERLHGLKTEHSDISVISHTRNKGGHVKREGVTSIHPLVRTHPVTGEKALFVNPLCKLDRDHDHPAKMRFLAHLVDTTKIIGFQKEESDALLTFLFNHIASSIDSQVRVKWAEKTVVLFDVGWLRKNNIQLVC